MHKTLETVVGESIIDGKMILQDHKKTNKLRLLRTFIVPIAAYGSETWTITEAMGKRMQTF